MENTAHGFLLRFVSQERPIAFPRSMQKPENVVCSVSRLIYFILRSSARKQIFPSSNEARIPPLCPSAMLLAMERPMPKPPGTAARRIGAVKAVEELVQLLRCQRCPADVHGGQQHAFFRFFPEKRRFPYPRRRISPHCPAESTPAAESHIRRRKTPAPAQFPAGAHAPFDSAKSRKDSAVSRTASLTAKGAKCRGVFSSSIRDSVTRS